MFRSLRDREGRTISSRRVQRRVSAESDLVQRLERQRVLHGHHGCVNTASFTPSGQGLLSGSDDQKIIHWDWATGEQKLKYNSGHRNNVFQARALPGNNDATIVTCAADGQVRVGHVSEAGRVETQRLALHQGRAHKLALVPDAPQCFLSCGEDGAVRHFDLRAQSEPGRRLLVCRAGSGRAPAFSTAIELNSIHCNTDRPWQFVIGGSDETVRVYDQRRVSGNSAASIAQPVRKLAPAHMRRGGSRHPVHVTCAMFSRQGEVVATYNDEDIYLFASEQQGAAKPSSGRSAAAGGGGGRASSPGKRSRAGASDIDAAVPSASKSADTRNGGAEHRAIAEAAAAADECRQEAAGQQDADRQQAGSAASPAAAAATGLQADGSAGAAVGSPASAGSQAPGIPQGFIGPPPPPPPPGDPPASSETRPDPWGEEDHPPPPRQPRRRRNAFMLPARLLRQGAVVPGSSDDDDEDREQEEEEPPDDSAPDEVLQRYNGHRNAQTVKGVAFCGAEDEYVMSGSDCGHIFIWDKVGGRLRACLLGDDHVVNCLEQHPTLPLTLATSGIDNDVKIWAPTAETAREPTRSAAVNRLLRDNSASRGEARSMRQVVITPRMLTQLLALHSRSIFGTEGPPFGSEHSADDEDEGGEADDDDRASEEEEDMDVVLEVESDEEDEGGG